MVMEAALCIRTDLEYAICIRFLVGLKTSKARPEFMQRINSLEIVQDFTLVDVEHPFDAVDGIKYDKE